ncbi:hypothetical protein LUX33_15550 [Actinomadura madurae]|uniref:hypothetical protein n=1 Tax=Actinomadura madurae TaxID=1993 RepID=UPI0020D2046C|nr:hypothetical protein [Actinomadura madurae]MCP9949671.1 hypothetical protein [Actinomadura madurae]
MLNAAVPMMMMDATERSTEPSVCARWARRLFSRAGLPSKTVRDRSRTLSDMVPSAIRSVTLVIMRCAMFFTISAITKVTMIQNSVLSGVSSQVA